MIEKKWTAGILESRRLLSLRNKREIEKEDRVVDPTNPS